MGAAVAQLSTKSGADIVVLDVADISYPASQSLKVDLRNKASVDSALSQINGNFDIVYACAGVADGIPGVTLINFISQRYIFETLLHNDRINKGGSIVMIASVAGLGWQTDLEKIKTFIDCTDWDSAVDWIAANEGTDSYMFSKRAINTYVASAAMPMMKQGVRINAVQPGPTDTPLARANADTWLTFGQGYRDDLGIGALSPDQIAYPMIFLASEAASGVNGITMIIDYGHVSAGTTDVYPDPIVKYLLGMHS